MDTAAENTSPVGNRPPSRVPGTSGKMSGSPPKPPTKRGKATKREVRGRDAAPTPESELGIDDLAVFPRLPSASVPPFSAWSQSLGSAAKPAPPSTPPSTPNLCATAEATVASMAGWLRTSRCHLAGPR